MRDPALQARFLIGMPFVLLYVAFLGLFCCREVLLDWACDATMCTAQFASQLPGEAMIVMGAAAWIPEMLQAVIQAGKEVRTAPRAALARCRCACDRFWFF